MKLPFLTGLLALALAVPAFSQEAASSLLGKRYVEVYTGLVASSPDDGYGVGTTFNAPIAAGLDAGATFQHNWLEGDRSNNYQDLGLHLAGYHDLGKVRVSVRATVGYEWWSVANEFWYQFDVGAEYAINDRLLVGAQAAWYDYFSSSTSDGAFSGGPKATYWITPAVAVSGTVSFLEYGDTAYVLGVAFVF